MGDDIQVTDGGSSMDGDSSHYGSKHKIVNLPTTSLHGGSVHTRRQSSGTHESSVRPIRSTVSKVAASVRSIRSSIGLSSVGRASTIVGEGVYSAFEYHDDDLDEDDDDEFNDHLDFGTNVFVGRDDELEKLNSVYARLCRNQSVTADASNKEAQIVLIDGYSGSGKSALVQKFMGPLLLKKGTIAKRMTKPCHVCQGKYDQYNTGGTLSAFVDAFSGFLYSLGESYDPEDAIEGRRIAKDIYDNMDQARQTFMGSIIPGLAAILDDHAAIEQQAELLAQDQSHHGSIVVEGTNKSIADASNESASFDRIRATRKRAPRTGTDAKEQTWGQLLFGMKVLIRAISSLERPLVLYIDDLQWADQSSLDLITELLLDSSVHNLLIIGSYRSNEVRNYPNHILNTAIPEWRRMKKTIHSISLDNLSESQVSHFLAKTLRLDVSKTQSLASILHKKTEGNVLYMIQALEELKRRKILTKNFSNMEWTWDDQQVLKDIDLAANVVDLITSKLHSMPEGLQECLMIASFLRSAFNQAVLESLLDQERSQGGASCLEEVCIDLDAVLDMAIHHGLLERTNAIASTTATLKIPSSAALEGHESKRQLQYEQKSKTILRFVHDRIQQAAFSMIPLEKLTSLKHRIGRHLLTLAQDPFLGENWMWFVAADQFESPDDFLMADRDIIPVLDLIRLNLKVGELAINVSAFLPAVKYLNRALHDLEGKIDDHWNSHYKLSLQIYKLLAEIELCLGNYESGTILANITLGHLTDPIEKIQIFTQLAMGCTKQERHEEGMNIILRSLYEMKTFPKRCHLFHVLREAKMVAKFMDKYTDEDILQFAPITDQKIKHSMRALLCMTFMAYFAGHVPTMLLAIIRQVRLTFEYGLSAEGASAFATYSSLLMNVLKQGDRAKRAANLSLKILDRTDSKHVEPNAIAAVSSFTKAWYEPIHKVLALDQRAHRTGMEIGDLDHAYKAWAQSLINAYTAGVPLTQIQKVARNLIAQAQHYRVLVISESYIYFLEMLEYLMGIRKGCIDKEAIDNAPSIKTIINSKYLTWSFFYWSQLQLAIYFNDLEYAKKMVVPFKAFSKKLRTYGVVSIRTFFCGLTNSRLARKTGKKKYIRRARQDFKEMKQFVELKQSTNNLHRFMLMQADLLAASDSSNEKDVKDAYDKAISIAARSGFIHDCALGNELAGDYCLSRIVYNARNSNQGGNTHANQLASLYDEYWPKEYFSNALSLYEEWGATAKVAQMKTKYAALLGSNLESAMGAHSRRRGGKHSTNTRSCLAAAHEMFAQVNLESV